MVRSSGNTTILSILVVVLLVMNGVLLYRLSRQPSVSRGEETSLSSQKKISSEKEAPKENLLTQENGESKKQQIRTTEESPFHNICLPNTDLSCPNNTNKSSCEAKGACIWIATEEVGAGKGLCSFVACNKFSTVKECLSPACQWHE